MPNFVLSAAASCGTLLLASTANAAYMTSDVNGCPGDSMVFSIEKCQQLAKKLNKPFRTNNQMIERPRGCLLINNDIVRYNPEEGQRWREAFPGLNIEVKSICKGRKHIVDAPTCRIEDNNCLFNNLHGGCTGVAANMPRKGLSNPFCKKTNGLKVISPTNSCQLEAIFKPVWDNLISRAMKKTDKERDLIGILVRLSFHDAMEFDKNTADNFGTDGCLATAGFEHDGLWEANKEIAMLLEPIWQEHCDIISRADFWVLMTTFAMRHADKTGQLNHLLKFESGRVDNCNCDATPESRFPHPGENWQTMQDRVFVNQMGLFPNDSTVLISGHTVGSISKTRGLLPKGATEKVNTPWTTNPTTFDNSYFREMVFKSWEPVHLNPNFNALPITWTDFGEKKDVRAMLNVDMVAAFDLEFVNHETKPKTQGPKSIQAVKWCGRIGRNGFGCGASDFGCCDETTVPGRADLVKTFIQDGPDGNNAYLRAWAASWTRMMKAGTPPLLLKSPGC